MRSIASRCVKRTCACAGLRSVKLAEVGNPRAMELPLAGSAPNARSRQGGRLDPAVAYIDIDDFCAVHEAVGEVGANAVLEELSHRLRNAIPPGAHWARLGGNAFSVMCAVDFHSGDVAEFETILDALMRPVRYEERQVRISASVGVAVAQAGAPSLDVMLRRAQHAAVAAKRAGGGRIRFYDDFERRQQQARQRLVRRVRQALAHGELCLHYQPVVDLYSGDVVGAEALCRWEHPQRGTLLPSEFLPAVERDELIVSIGDWAISQAVDQCMLWARDGRKWSVSVNITGRHLLRPELLASLRLHLHRFGGRHEGALRLELVETVDIHDWDAASHAVRECASLGVPIYLDDFGIGHSTLASLRRLPVFGLKLDRSFIRTMLSDDEDRIIVQSTLDLARALGKAVVAEGVETVEQGRALVEMGCRLGQGFAIARAMPARDFADWAESYERNPLLPR